MCKKVKVILLSTKNKKIMRINEIFYSIQGEGTYTGTPCVFVRFAGCNLKCPFCDTKHEPYKEYTDEDIIREIEKYPTKHVVLTGGEPTLQITEEFIYLLHAKEYFIHIETNGTRNNKAILCADWITCSPKFDYSNKNILLKRIDELKVVFDAEKTYMDKYEDIDALKYYLQPCDLKDRSKTENNIRGVINYCLSHPKWAISLQTHKILKVR